MDRHQLAVVDKGPLPISLRVVHQHVMDHPVGEVRGEDLPELRPLGNKADRGAGRLPRGSSASRSASRFSSWCASKRRALMVLRLLLRQLRECRYRFS
jgi:hypothetical protein